MSTTTDFRGIASFGDFVFKHECRSFCDAYVAALKILGEKSKKQWTTTDVVIAVLRATESPNTQAERPPTPDTR
jgi:hypothetical protein